MMRCTGVTQMYKGNLVRLRALESADAGKIAAWMSDRETVINTSGSGRMPATYDNEIEQVRAGAYSTFAIERLSDGEFIGTCGFFGVDGQGAGCSVSIMIGDAENRDKGYGADAMAVLLKFLFVDKNMYRVGLKVFSYNTRAVHLYEKMGFVRELTFREQAYMGGRYWDVYGYSMLREEYMERYGD